MGLVDQHPSEAMLISQPLRQALGLHKRIEDPLELASGNEGALQLEPRVDELLHGRNALGQSGERGQRLLIRGRGLSP